MKNTIVFKCVNLVILSYSYVTHTDSTLITFGIN